MLSSDAQDGIHVRRLPIQMYRNDSFGLCRDDCCDSFGCDVECSSVRLNRDGCSASVGDREPSGDERIARNNHFVADADLVSDENQMKGLEAVPEPHAIIRLAIGCKLTLELLEFLSQQVRS